MCGVGVAVDVYFDGCVDGYDTESAYHFGVVADFCRSYGEVIFEVIHVVVDLHEAFVGYAE